MLKQVVLIEPLGFKGLIHEDKNIKKIHKRLNSTDG
jgi:hypothetical protein